MIWITRGTNAKLNREAGVPATGGFDSRVPGPDGISNSAMKFTGATSLVVSNTQILSGDFTIQFGYKRSV